MKLSIVIPVKLKLDEHIMEFVNHTISLAKDIQNEDVQIVVADESNDYTFNFINSYFHTINNITHFVPSTNLRTGANDKLNGIYAALDYVKYDKILLVDDHFRITKETVKSIYKYFDKYDCFKTMPKFNKHPFSVLVDMCGMFVVNIIDSKKQYCGHLAFRKEHINKFGFPSRDALFDELALEFHLREHNCSVGFVKDVALEAVQEISFGKFLEQRVRYAYENFALPLRFTFFSLILPLLIVLFTINVNLAIIAFMGLTLGVTLLAFVGQLIYGASLAPWYTFLLTPIWFWFYPITTWIALYKYFTGGVMFGGRKIRRAK
ncbi:glycosyltransferase [Bacillus mycoides]